MLFHSLASLAATLQLAAAVNLYATHYDGSLSTLKFENNALTVTKKEKNCGTQPSWLTYDASTKNLYCLEESYFAGTLYSYSVGSSGLTPNGNAPTLGNPVHSTMYGGSNGNSFMAVAHYSGAAFSTFKLPVTSGAAAMQSFTYTMARPGPNASRQDKPHPHAAVLDPTGAFMLVPDLGADLVRIYSINQSTGQLTSCSNYTAKAGSGPRHASFFVPAGASNRSVAGRRAAAAAPAGTIMYLGNELANTITSFSVGYPSGSGGCLTLTETKTLAPYPNNQVPSKQGIKVAEVQVKGLTLTTSNRADNSFGNNNDSLALFTLSSSGEFTFASLYPTYASYPRTMVINKAGNMVAIGNQNSGSVTVVERNNSTGVFGKLLGTASVGPTGSNGNGGLSSVIWEE